MESKFVKAYCAKVNRYFGLEMKKYSGEWQVTNFIELKEDEAKLLTSEVRQSVYKSYKNLLPCRKCGKRVVSGCNCASRMFQCRPNMPYRFNCLYCNELKIDLEEADTTGRVGEKITLSQGQVVEIKASSGAPIKNIKVGVGWDENTSGDKIDVDASVVVANKEREDADLVYYNELEHSSGCVIHHGDNRTGSGSGDDEIIDVFLDKVPQSFDTLYFVLNIYDCVERNQTFKIINNLYIRLFDPITGKTLIEYRVIGNYDKFTGIIIAKAFRSGSGWKFKAIGVPTNDKRLGELADRCFKY